MRNLLKSIFGWRPRERDKLPDRVQLCTVGNQPVRDWLLVVPGGDLPNVELNWNMNGRVHAKTEWNRPRKLRDKMKDRRDDAPCSVREAKVSRLSPVLRGANLLDAAGRTVLTVLWMKDGRVKARVPGQGPGLVTLN